MPSRLCPVAPTRCDQHGTTHPAERRPSTVVDLAAEHDMKLLQLERQLRVTTEALEQLQSEDGAR